MLEKLSIEEKQPLLLLACGVLVMGLAALWWVPGRQTVLDWRPIIVAGLILDAAAIALFWHKQSYRQQWKVMLILFVAALPAGAAAAIDLNSRFERGRVENFETEVLSQDAADKTVTLAPWGPFTQPMVVKSINTEERPFKTGGRACLIRMSGALLIPHYSYWPCAERSTEHGYTEDDLPMPATFQAVFSGAYMPCLHDAALAKTRRCGADGYWFDFETTFYHLYKLYDEERFDLLEKAFYILSRPYQRYGDGTMKTRSLMRMFEAQIGQNSETLKKADAKLAKWQTEVPYSQYVDIARAYREYNYALQLRGTGDSSSVSPETDRIFRGHLQKSRQMLLDSKSADRDTPLYHSLLLMIMLAEDNPQAGHEFDEDVTRWPGYYDFYESVMYRMTPQWGGSWAMVEKFVRATSEKQRSREGNTLYARLYFLMNVALVTDMRDTELDWSIMMDSLQALTATYASPELINFRAGLACAYKDRDEFVIAVKNLSRQEVNDRYWMDGYPYEPCKRWAGL